MSGGESVLVVPWTRSPRKFSLKRLHLSRDLANKKKPIRRRSGEECPSRENPLKIKALERGASTARLRSTKATAVSQCDPSSWRRPDFVGVLYSRARS